MEIKKTAKSYSPEVKERAVRRGLEHQGEHATQGAALCSIAAKIGCSWETLRKWVRRHERAAGLWEGMISEVRERLKALERENREVRQANETPGLRRGRLCARRRLFCPGGARPRVQAMIAVIDKHRAVHGVAPICRVFP